MVVFADQKAGDQNADREQQCEVAVRYGQQAAEQHRLHLVNVELSRERDQQTQAQSERERVKDANQCVGWERRVPLDVHHAQRRQ